MNEVSSIIYLEEEELLIVICFHSEIRIYSSREGEENEFLRSFKGGHLDKEITSSTYSRETLMLFTGAVDGTICHWNVENSKLEFTFKEE